MLNSLPRKLCCPSCRRQDARLTTHVFRESVAAGAVRDGVLICEGCGEWYQIEDHLLDLEAAGLRNESERDSFRSEFHQELARAGIRPLAQNGPGQAAGSFEAQRKQRNHFDLAAEKQMEPRYNYSLQPFWRAAYNLTFDRWSERIRPGSHLLDVGCADGRSSFYWARRGVNVTGFDISKGLIRQAIQRAQAERLEERTTFFVGDGRHPPFKDETFDNALTYGVLHHLPEPGAACRAIQRVLAKGGIHFGSENNQSSFRGLFDALMKVLPIWIEEAGEQPLLSRRMLCEWLDGWPARIETRTRSEEHTSELQSHSFISYAVFCLKKKTQNILHTEDGPQHHARAHQVSSWTD